MNFVHINKRIDNFASEIWDKISNPQNSIEALFYLTQNCNLTCRGCYMRELNDNHGKTMPANDVLRYLRMMHKQEHFFGSVVFSGGEIFTLPTQYLQTNVQNAVDINEHIHLKTNLSWIQNPQTANEIFNMLKNINADKLLTATDQEINDFLSKIGKEKCLELGHNRLHKMMLEHLPSVPPIDICTSIDNKIHPHSCSQWFISAINKLSQDTLLNEKVQLKTFSFLESFDFFVKNILKSPKLKIENIETFGEYNEILTYTANGINITSFFGQYFDTKQKFSPETMTDVIVESPSGPRIVYYFYPDRTVALDANMRPVGRISYVTKTGNLKSIKQIQQEIAKRATQEYAHLITR